MNKHAFSAPVRRRAMALAASALAAGALAGPALADTNSATTPPDGAANYSFSTLNDNHDTTFNQLLGINDSGLIAGYFGSGMSGHPNRGYTLAPPYGQGAYHNENVPGAAQTQVTGLNNNGLTVGFYVDQKGANLGFYKFPGRGFHTVKFPANNNASPAFDQLLGVNDRGIAVGFYNDGQGNAHGYTYNINTGAFHRVRIMGATSVTAAAINNLGDVAGFAAVNGNTVAFLQRADGKTFMLSVPGAAGTQAFGLNDGEEVVGAYTMGSGNNATTDGFTWAPGYGFQTVDDPNGQGATTINGVNDHGQLVGFYTDSAGNTDGMLATPQM